MALRPPLLDARSFSDILAQLNESAERHFPQWQPGDEADPGVMLQHTFARLMEIIIERLNRAPEKHMLAFLAAMGISPLLPVPAQTALVFSLKKDALLASVPKGTAITAITTDGGPALTFTTKENLTVLPTAIGCAYTYEPGCSRYGDYTGCINGEGFTPFCGDRAIPDAFYFIDDIALSIEQPTKIYLVLNFKQKILGSLIRNFLNNLNWFYSDDEGLSRFYPKFSLDNITYYTSLKLEMDPPFAPSPAVHLGGGCEPPAGRYFKCLLKNSFEAKAAAEKIAVSFAEIEVWGQECQPQHLFFNKTRLDPDSYFLPFGDRPQDGDTFYIDMGDFFSRPGGAVFLNMNLTSGLVGRDRRWCQLNWSYFAPDGWQPIAVEESGSWFSGNYISLVFISPDNMTQRKVNGVNGHWLRVVLPPGDYGSEARYILQGSTYVLAEGSGVFLYPKVKSIYLKTKYGVTKNINRATCRAYRQRGHIYSPINEAAPSPLTNPELSGSYFYLGFDHLLPQEPISLYADAEPIGVRKSITAAVTWEYLSNNGWQTLYVQDDTSDLSRSGMVRFSSPADCVCEPIFDNTARSWIRLSKSGDVRLKGIYLNAVTAEQAVAVPREALGSSNGSPDQSFHLRWVPVLKEQKIWVREAEAPTAAELVETLLEKRQNQVTQEEEYWVLWQEQNSFGASEAFSRHYVLDHNSGEIRFGDGSRGMIPEKGSAIVAQYRFGGGVRGNLPAAVITKPTTVLKGIERVYNPIPATGGAQLEEIMSILERGPMALRHRGRGVTALDLEWLVKEAAGEALDRIKCLPGEGKQPSTLLLLPAIGGLRPLPDGTLAARIHDYLASRIPAATGGGNAFKIIGPRYLKVGVSVDLIPANHLESSLVRERTVHCLHTYLHPRRGGRDGLGWPFGRNVYLSEICAVLEEVEGVSRALAATVFLYPAALQRQLSLEVTDARLSIAYPAGSLISLNDPLGRVSCQWLLAEAIETDSLPNAINITGLREGDLLDITYPFIYSGGNFSKEAPIDFPGGSLARFSDGATTTLKQDLPKGERLKGTMLNDPGEIKEGTVITLIYPDALLITDLSDNESGYSVSASCLREEAPLAKDLILECSQSKVKAELKEALWDGSQVSLQFPDIAPGQFKLSHPEGLSDPVTMKINSVQPITDIVYLFEHELCTPGVIELRIKN
ncbi:MAG: putative baseplate assembly protein [Clostridiales bacterium]|nr:putative baseplate assembly protein [Clostridiales bacterium]